MGLDRDSTLPLQVHRIEELILFFAGLNRSRALKQTIRQRRFAMIDVRDDAEISGELDRHGGPTMRVRHGMVNGEGGARGCHPSVRRRSRMKSVDEEKTSIASGGSSPSARLGMFQAVTRAAEIYDSPQSPFDKPQPFHQHPPRLHSDPATDHLSIRRSSRESGSSWPRSQASSTIVVWHTFETCSITLSSQSRLARFIARPPRRLPRVSAARPAHGEANYRSGRGGRAGAQPERRCIRNDHKQ